MSLPFRRMDFSHSPLFINAVICPKFSLSFPIYAMRFIVGNSWGKFIMIVVKLYQTKSLYNSYTP